MLVARRPWKKQATDPFCLLLVNPSGTDSYHLWSPGHGLEILYNPFTAFDLPRAPSAGHPTFPALCFAVASLRNAFASSQIQPILDNPPSVSSGQEILSPSSPTLDHFPLSLN